MNTRRLHAETYAARAELLQQLQSTVINAVLCDEAVFPCLDGRGPTPLAVARVLEPEDPTVDGMQMRIYDTAKRDEPGFYISVIDFESGDETHVVKINQRQGSISRAGIIERAVPMREHNYRILGSRLQGSVVSREDGLSVIEALTGEGYLEADDEYLRRLFMTRRQRVGEFITGWMGIAFPGLLPGMWFPR